jgi:hypothetical protein
VDCLGSLLIFLGFWSLEKVAEMVNWILSLAPPDILEVSRVRECGGEGMVERERWIQSWTDLRSLLIFLGFWRLGNIVD